MSVDEQVISIAIIWSRTGKEASIRLGNFGVLMLKIMFEIGARKLLVYYQRLNSRW
jgi:hypothetical protein